MRNQRGITLIALVITIIVLLILAGVSIAMLTGENGILTKATESTEKTQKAEAEEALKLTISGILSNMLDPTYEGTENTISKSNIETMIQKINSNVTASCTEGSGNLTVSLTINSTTYEGYTVNTTNGKITMPTSAEG